jgi:nucleoid-associated protein YgaU
MFAPTSRYAGIEFGTTTTAGRAVRYVRRRLLGPVPAASVQGTEHVVLEGDRLDNLAARYLEDPEQFWRIADVNRAMRPEELAETPGRRLRIPLLGGGDGGGDA